MYSLAHVQLDIIEGEEPIIQPTTRGWTRCFAFTCVALSCSPSLRTVSDWNLTFLKVWFGVDTERVSLKKVFPFPKTQLETLPTSCSQYLLNTVGNSLRHAFQNICFWCHKKKKKRYHTLKQSLKFFVVGWLKSGLLMPAAAHKCHITVIVSIFRNVNLICVTYKMNISVVCRNVAYKHFFFFFVATGLLTFSFYFYKTLKHALSHCTDKFIESCDSFLLKIGLTGGFAVHNTLQYIHIWHQYSFHWINIYHHILPCSMLCN